MAISQLSSSSWNYETFQICVRAYFPNSEFGHTERYNYAVIHLRTGNWAPIKFFNDKDDYEDCIKSGRLGGNSVFNEEQLTNVLKRYKQLEWKGNK